MTSWPALIRNRIGGEDRAARSEKALEVINPHNGEVLTRLARSDLSDVHDAVAAAREAQLAWADTPAAQDP